MNHITHIIIALMLLITPSCGKSTTNKKKVAEKPAIVHTSALPAGWYTRDEKKLSAEIDDYLKLAEKEFAVPMNPLSVKALIVPHAGHYYSGLCAATAYQTLRQDVPERKNQTIKRVIILAPSHTEFFNGVSLPYYTHYETVLGKLPVDDEAIKILSKNHFFKQYPDPHFKEHAIEVQLPFIQKTIADCKIVPLIVGHIKHNSEYYFIAEELKKIINDTTLVIVSSDFVHHGPNYNFTLFDKNISQNIRFLDSLALQSIMAKSLPLFTNVLQETEATICGREPIKLLLALFEKQALGVVEPRLACAYTSANIPEARKTGSLNCKALVKDIADQDFQNCVSYISLIFTTQPLTALKNVDRLTGYEKKALIQLARATLENEFRDEKTRIQEYLIAPCLSPGIEQKTGTFVTLTTKTGDLRGCIGRIFATEPLYKAVINMSKAAAFNDSRFSPVKSDELASLMLDISILSAPMSVQRYADIKIGKHGIILTKRGLNNHPLGSAVFLPQVAPSHGWNLEKTLEELSLKAGFGENGWKEHCTFEVFEGFEIKE